VIQPLYRYIRYMRRWVRSIKEVGAATLMHNLYSLRGILDVLQIVATIINALLSVLMTLRIDERMKDEKLRESFKAIVKELYKAKKYVKNNLIKLKELETSDVVKRLDEIPLGSSDTPKNVIRKDLERYYQKGIKLLDDIKKCNSKIREYNKKYDEFRSWLYGRIEEKLKERGIHEDDVIKDILIRWHSDRVLHVLESEKEPSKEQESLYQEIRSSKEFRDYLNALKNIAKNKVEPCLEELEDELDKVIDDIMRRFALSEREIATEKDQEERPDLGSPLRGPLKLLIADHDRLHANNKRRAPKA